LARPTLSRRASAESFITNPYAAPSPRPAARSTGCTHREPINRYEDVRPTRDRELSALAERLERLENVNERLLSTLVPLFERIADRLVFTGAPSSAHARMGYGYHHSYPSRSEVVPTRGRSRRNTKRPQRLESVDSFNNFDGLDLDRPSLPHLRPQNGSHKDGRAMRGAQVVGEIGYDTEDGYDDDHDANHLSWLRSDSGLDSRETLSSDYGDRRGLPVPDDHLFPESVADDGSWRRLASTSRRQRPPQDAVLGEHAGLGSLESVMWDVIRGAY
jgi:hypothetical protein